MPLPSEDLPKVNSEIEIPKAGEKNALDLLEKFLKLPLRVMTKTEIDLT
jgi:hypothetical protein